MEIAVTYAIYRESQMCVSQCMEKVSGDTKAMNVLANMGVRARASCFTWDVTPSIRRLYRNDQNCIFSQQATLIRFIKILAGSFKGYNLHIRTQCSSLCVSRLREYNVGTVHPIITISMGLNIHKYMSSCSSDFRLNLSVPDTASWIDWKK